MSSTLTLENVLYEKKGSIAYVSVNRPKVLNALNQKTWENLRAAFEDVRDDTAIRGAIITGAGDKAFIAGADISELAKITAVEAEKSSSYGQEVLNLVENLGKPVIGSSEWLCTWRRMRNCHGLFHQGGSRRCEIWAA